LEKLLGLELTLEATLAGEAAEAERPRGAPAWSAIVARGALQQLPSLQLDELTEFDPQACLYRAGRWTRPAAGSGVGKE
jgi:hypothetical protein